MTAADHRWAYGWFITDPLSLVFLGVICIYFVAFEGLAGFTVGKWILGLRIIGPDDRRPGLSRSLLRNVLRAVDALPALNILGVVLIACSPEKARFGDRVARTRMIHIW